MYGVTTSSLNQAVQRNRERPPEDFMFRPGKRDTEFLRSQFVIAKPDGPGGRRFAPDAFTEQGIAMLSSVLRSQRAVQVNVAIMRTFVRLLETPIPAKKTIGFHGQIGSPAKSGKSRRRKRNRQKTSNL